MPPLHNACVDPRFDLVSPHGRATAWNDMGNGNRMRAYDGLAPV